jgi:hypothetical protein
LRTILQRPEHAQKQSLSRRAKQIDAIKVNEPGDELGINFGEQPLTGIAAVEGGTRMNGSAVHQLCNSLFANSGFSLDGGHLQVGGDNFDLADKSARGSAKGDERRLWFGVREIQGTRPNVLWLQKILSRHARASPL